MKEPVCLVTGVGLDKGTGAEPRTRRARLGPGDRVVAALQNRFEAATLHTAIEIEGQAQGRLRSSDDFRESVESFYEKRKTVFKGS